MRLLKLLVLSCLLALPALAADITWTNTSSGYWTNGANWGGGNYPGQYALDNAIIPSGVTVTLDKTPDFFVGTITSGGHLFITNTVDTGTTTLTLSDNSRLTIAAGSRWRNPASSGTKNITGTNVVIDVQSNALWEAYTFNNAVNTIGGAPQFIGSGTIRMRSTEFNSGVSSGGTAANNTILVNGLRLERMQPHAGIASAGNTMIFTNVTSLPGYGGSWRIGETAPAVSNTIVLTGSNTVMNTGGSYVYVGYVGGQNGSTLRIENGATLTNVDPIVYSVNIPNTAPAIGNVVRVSSGGRIFWPNISVGTGAGCHSNVFEVTGLGSIADLRGYVNASVGNATTASNNVLRIADNGIVRGVLALAIATNNILDFTSGILSAHDFTYSGARYVLGSNCTLIAEYGPTPTAAGNWSFLNGLTIASNATLRGRGNILVGGGGLVVTNGGTIIGSLQGILNVTNTTWAGGGKFVDKISFMGSRAGEGRALLNVGTQLTFVASTPNYLIALDSDGHVITDFDPAENYVLKPVQAGLLTGYDPATITVLTNDFLLGATPTKPWIVTNFAGKIFVTYTGTPEDDSANGQTWANTSNGNWSVASNWTNNNSATSGVGVILEFSGTGTNRYFSTNNVANPFDLYKILITSSSTRTNVITGLPLRFNGADAGIFHNSGGDTIISNSLSFTSNAWFWGTESLEGGVTIATNMTVAGNMYKTGKWTLYFKGSNSIAGSVVVNSRGGGGIQLDSLAHLSSGNVILSNGVINRTTATAHTFGNLATLRDYRIMGPGSLYQLTGPYIVGSNATVTVTNQAQLRAPSVVVNSAGTVADPFHICGGEVYTTTGSGIGFTNSNNRVTIHDGGLWDCGAAIFYVGNGTGSNNVLILDNGMLDVPSAVHVGGIVNVQGGDYNGIIITNGGVLRFYTTGVLSPWRIGSGTNANYNFLDVRAGGRCELRGGSGNNQAHHTIGFGPGAIGNWVRVDGGTISDVEQNNQTGMRIGGGRSALAGARNVGNHLDILNGGFVQCNRGGASSSDLVVGGANAAATNYVYISGTGSTYNLEGQSLYVSGFSGCTGNYVRVENGGLIDNGFNVYVGSTFSSGDRCVGNYLSVSNASVVSGINGSPAAVGGSFNDSGNYIEILKDGSWIHSGPLAIGGGVDSTASNNVGNYVLLDGGTVTDITTVRLGSGTGTPKSHDNYMILTNNASLNSIGICHIGYVTGSHSNWVAVYGSTWDLGSSTLTVGTDSGCIGNKLIVGTGGYLGRVQAFTVSSNNTVELNGGYVDANTTTINGTLAGQGTIDDVHGLGLDTTTFGVGAVLAPTGILNLNSIALPTNMIINASNLVGTVVVSYNGTAYGATELSGWPVLGGPAGYVAKLDKATKTIRLVDPTKVDVMGNRNKVFIRNQQLLMRR